MKTIVDPDTFESPAQPRSSTFFPPRSPAAEERGAAPQEREATLDNARATWRDRLLVDTLAGILRHRVMAIMLPALCVIAAAAATLRMPPYYIATATIFPSSGANPMGALGFAGIASIMGNIGSMDGGSSEFPIYENVIHSQHLINELLRMPVGGSTQTLLDHLEIEDKDPAVRAAIGFAAIRDNVSYDTDKKTGLVMISYRDRDPAVAAHVTNRILELLNKFDVSTSADQAREKRHFVDARLEEARQELLRVEKGFETFSEENLRIGNAPDLLLQRARLEREVAIEQEVYLALRKEAEMARIDEQRAVPVVNVLDSATPPLLPAGPSMVRNVAFGGIVGVFLVVAMFAVAAMPIRDLRATLHRLSART